MKKLAHLPIAAALILVLGTIGACGNDKQKDQLDGNIGPGAGQPTPTPATGTSQSQDIVRPDGTAIGQFTFDLANYDLSNQYLNGFFTFTTPDPTQIGVLTAVAPGAPDLAIQITHISGRPDTPCRFDAAVLARDGGFTIGDTGMRSNALGQQLYQVNLSGNGQYAQLFCANLTGNSGAQFSIIADAPNKVTWLQVYAVLNSIQAK